MARAATAPEDLPDDGAVPGATETERESIVRAIGPKVHRLRQDNGLSLQQLARRADVSAAAIHKVERGDMVPTVTTLLKLAAALGRPMGHFVDAGGEPVPVAHVVRADRRPAAPSLPGVALTSLSGPPERFTMRGRVADVAPGADLVPDPHGGEDLFLVLAGSLHVSVGDEQYSLGDGDSVHVPPGHSVRVHNVLSEPARVLWAASRGN